MTIHLKLDLYHPAELEAFGKFATELAAARRTVIADEQNRYDKLPGLGAIIGKAQDNLWQNARYAPEAELPEEAQAAKVETTATPSDPAASAPARERGKPSPGHARRTKAEIAEDEAAAKSQSSIEIVSQTDVTTEESNLVEDTPEVQAADAADEAAETAANKPADAPPTVEDIRNVLGTYVKVYGMDAAMADGPVVISEICGEGVAKVSSVPEDKIADVIAALKKAGNENRFQRAQVAS